MKWLVILKRLMILAPLLLTFAVKAGAQNAGYIEKPITFAGAGGVMLAGTLTLPSASGLPVPGLVLIAGSGPTDRDGNQGLGLQTDLLKQIARRLAQEGITSLRYDKRGVGGSAMSAQERAHLADFQAWENFVGDAVAALHSLQNQPGLDARRTGYLGHSEGGLIALQAADQIQADQSQKGHAQPPSLLVLASTAGRTMDVVINEQLARVIKLQGATPAQSDDFLAKNRKIAAEIEHTGIVPDDVPNGLAFLYSPSIGKFLRGFLSADPVKLAAQFSGPVLVLQGQKDVQVSPERDAPALKAALSRRAHSAFQVSLIPNASHNLKSVTDDSDPGIAGPVVPEALSALCGWLHSTWKIGASR